MVNPKRYSEKVRRKDDEKKSGLRIPSGSYNMMDELSIIQPLFESHFQSIFDHDEGAEIHAKLEISQPEDESEMQADEMAESFMDGDFELSQEILSEPPTEILRKSEGDAMQTSSGFDQQLQSTKGQGQKLDEGTKGELEQHTGTDLSTVNIHTNSQAHDMSESINAKAFTHGQDIYFKEGNYNPQSEEGKSLLAHEVAHTVQQGKQVQRMIQRKIDPQTQDLGETTRIAVTFIAPFDIITETDKNNAVAAFLQTILLVDAVTAQSLAKNRTWPGLDKTYAKGDTVKTSISINYYMLELEKYYGKGLPHVKEFLLEYSATLTPTQLFETTQIVAQMSPEDYALYKSLLLPATPTESKEEQFKKFKTGLETFASTRSFAQNEEATRNAMDPLEGTESLYNALQAMFDAENDPFIAPEDQNSYDAQVTKAIQDKKAGVKSVGGMAKLIYPVIVELEGNGFGEINTSEDFWNSIQEYSGEQKSFVDYFKSYMVNVADNMLYENEGLIREEGKRYGALPGNDKSKENLKSLRDILAPQKPKYQQASDLRSDASMNHSKIQGKADEIVYDDEGKALLNKAAGIENQARQEILKSAGDYPILAAYDPDSMRTLVMASDDNAALSSITTLTNQYISNITELRKTINSDDPDLKKKIWQLDNVVDRAKAELGIIKDSVFDKMIIAVEEHATAFDLKDLFMLVLSIGLAILAVSGVGTPIAIAAGIGSVGMGAYSAYKSYEQFAFQSEAFGSAYDKANTLSSQQPSAFWLALDIVFLVADLGAAAKAFKSLAPAAEALIEGKALIQGGEAMTTEEFEKIVNAEADSLEQAGKIKNAKQFAASIMKKVKDPEELEKLKKLFGERKKLIEENADRAIELRKLYPGISDVQLGGALELEKRSPQLLKSIQTLFGDNQQIQRLLFHYSGTSDTFVGSLDKLLKGLSENQFGQVVRSYMNMTTHSARRYLSVIEEAGLDENDIKLISQKMSSGTPSEMLRIFRKELRAAVLNKISGAADKGFSKLMQLTNEMQEGQSGQLFSDWARATVDGGQGFGEKVLRYLKKVVRPDNIIEYTNEVEFSEFKHFRVPKGLDAREMEQLKTYFSMLQSQFKYNGKVFTKLKYVFSNIESATMNKEVIKGISSDIKVFYIDVKTGLMTELE